MGKEVLQNSDMTSDLEESILNQYKVPKEKVSTGKPKQGPYSWWDVVIRGRDLRFVQILDQLTFLQGFPRWLSGKEFACQRRRCRRHRFDPWVGKIPWRRKWQPAPVFLLGKFHEQRSLLGYDPEAGRGGEVGSQKVEHDWGTEHAHMPLKDHISSLV